MARSHYLLARGEFWQKQRMRALVRDNFTCQWKDSCTELGGRPETRLRYLIVHHKKMRINGGDHRLSNLVTLCRVHHAEIHPHLRNELEMHPVELEGYPLREL